MTHQVTERCVALCGATAEFVGPGEGLRRLVEAISRDWENGGVAVWEGPRLAAVMLGSPGHARPAVISFDPQSPDPVAAAFRPIGHCSAGRGPQRAPPWQRHGTGNRPLAPWKPEGSPTRTPTHDEPR